LLLKELENRFSAILRNNKNDNTLKSAITITLSQLIYMYNIDEQLTPREDFYKNDDENECIIKTEIFDQNTLEKGFEFCENMMHRGLLPLSNLINNLELVQPINR